VKVKGDAMDVEKEWATRHADLEEEAEIGII
jgi:hypothetical protein